MGSLLKVQTGASVELLRRTPPHHGGTIFTRPERHAIKADDYPLAGHSISSIQALLAGFSMGQLVAEPGCSSLSTALCGRHWVLPTETRALALSALCFLDLHAKAQS